MVFNLETFKAMIYLIVIACNRQSVEASPMVGHSTTLLN